MTPNSGLIGRICEACVTSLPVNGAAVSAVLGDGNRGTVYASDSVVARLEEVQFELGEGPGADAFRAGRPVLVPDLADPVADSYTRWPAFAPAAVQAGARSLFAFPLLLGAAQIGLLGMYRADAFVLDVDTHARALRLADAALFALLDLFDVPDGSPQAATDAEYAVDAGDVVGDVLDDGFLRAEVYQAAGMVMEQLGVPIEEAVSRLRAYSFAHSLPVSQVAGDIVARKLRLQADNA